MPNYPEGNLQAQIMSWLEVDGWSAQQESPDLLGGHVEADSGALDWCMSVEDVPDEVRLRLASSCPVRVPEARLPALAELFTRLNAVVRGSGFFYLLFDSGKFGHESALDLMDGKLTLKILQQLFVSNLQALDQAIPLVMAVAFGPVSPEQAIRNNDEAQAQADAKAELALECAPSGSLLQ